MVWNSSYDWLHSMNRIREICMAQEAPIFHAIAKLSEPALLAHSKRSYLHGKMVLVLIHLKVYLILIQILIILALVSP